MDERSSAVFSEWLAESQFGELRTPEEWKRFSDSLKELSLREWDFSNHELDVDGVKSIVDALLYAQVDCVRLRTCRLSADSVRPLSEAAVSNGGVRCMDVSDNPLGEEGGRVLLAVLEKSAKTIEQVIARDCGIDQTTLSRIEELGGRSAEGTATAEAAGGLDAMNFGNFDSDSSDDEDDEDDEDDYDDDRAVCEVDEESGVVAGRDSALSPEQTEDVPMRRRAYTLRAAFAPTGVAQSNVRHTGRVQANLGEVMYFLHNRIYRGDVLFDGRIRDDRDRIHEDACEWTSALDAEWKQGASDSDADSDSGAQEQEEFA